MLSFFKCVLCSVLINVHEFVLKMNVENMHGEKIKTVNAQNKVTCDSLDFPFSFFFTETNYGV